MRYIKCKICNKTVFYSPSKIRKYCSNKCAHIDRIVPMPKCPICGNPKKSRSAWKYCSLKCRNKGKSFTGHRCWKGGKHINSRGYVMIFIPKEKRKTSSKYKHEHRIIMERHLGRSLKKIEHVHHKNHDRSDNRIENLVLVSPSEHLRLHHAESREKNGVVSEFSGQDRFSRYKKGLSFRGSSYT